MTNAELAQGLRDLRDFLIIAGYEESHATRYSHISRHIDKMPESVETLRAEGRLGDIPGVGKLVALYIKQLLETGTCDKYREWETAAPLTVLEMVRIPGLGAKTARRLFTEFGTYDLTSFRLALGEGRLEGQPGIGPKTLATWRAYLGMG